MPKIDRRVLRVDEYDPRLVRASLGVLHGSVRNQDHQITRVNEMRCSAIDSDHPGAALAGDRVGHQPSAVVDIDNGHLFALEQIRGVHQVRIDGHRTDVVQVGLGDRSAVDFRLQHCP